jgi:hypothetical protein
MNSRHGTSGLAGPLFWGFVALGCMFWSVYAWSMSSDGIADRFGRTKGWDFPQFYVAGQLARSGDTAALFDAVEFSRRIRTLLPESNYVPVYGPQVGLAFAPLASLPYLGALAAWLIVSAALYAGCCRRLARASASTGATAAAAAVASPAFFFVVIYGQLSTIALACWTAAFLCLRRGHRVAAGFALGTLVFKPQLGIAVAVVALCAGEWRLIAGGVLGASVQIALTWAVVGTAAMRLYLDAVVRLWGVRDIIQEKWHLLQSLPAFLQPLVPARAGMPIYVALSVLVLLLTCRIWRSHAALDVRFSAVLLATALVSPHMYVYDLVILTPVWYLVSSTWTGGSATAGTRTMQVLVASLYLLPIAAPPLAGALRIQLSSPVLMGTLILLWQRYAVSPRASVARPTAHPDTN